MKYLNSRHLKLCKEIPTLHKNELLKRSIAFELIKECKGLYQTCLTPFGNYIEYNESGIKENTFYSNNETIKISIYQSKNDNLIYVKSEKFNNLDQYYILKLTMGYIQKLTKITHRWEFAINNYQFHDNINSIAEINKNSNVITWYNLIIDNYDISYSKLVLDSVINDKLMEERQKNNIQMLEIF